MQGLVRGGRQRSPVHGVGILTVILGATIASLWGSPAAAQERTPVYTEGQATAGRTLCAETCARCHGADLSDGSAPPLAGPTFRRTWSRPNVNVADLLYVMETTMPPRRVGQLSQEESVSILAYIMSQNGLRAGSAPLVADPVRLAAISLLSEQDALAGTADAFIQGERSQPVGTGPTASDLLGTSSDEANWLYHTRDYSGTRYSPLDQITTENVGELAPACLYQLGEPQNFQTGPVVFDGVMYVPGVRTTAAIEADSCRQIWRHVWEPRDREVWLNNRGVAIQDGYVVRATSDGYLVALDAADGALLWARQAADPWRGETFTMAPLLYDGMILIGPAGSENAISGWVGAFRLADGEEI